MSTWRQRSPRAWPIRSEKAFQVWRHRTCVLHSLPPLRLWHRVSSLRFREECPFKARLTTVLCKQRQVLIHSYCLPSWTRGGGTCWTACSGVSASRDFSKCSWWSAFVVLSHFVWTAVSQTGQGVHFILLSVCWLRGPPLWKGVVGMLCHDVDKVEVYLFMLSRYFCIVCFRDSNSALPVTSSRLWREFG